MTQIGWGGGVVALAARWKGEEGIWLRQGHRIRLITKNEEEKWKIKT